jgi:hypothetical protein
LPIYYITVALIVPRAFRVAVSVNPDDPTSAAITGLQARRSEVGDHFIL